MFVTPQGRACGAGVQELMTQQEYLIYIGKESTGIATDGHFSG